MWPSECNGFQINSKHAAYLLAGSSGQIGVVEVNTISLIVLLFMKNYIILILKLNKPGRLPDSTINSIVNKSKVSDFQWDPFDEESLAVGSENILINYF
jgi:coronin-7